MPNLPLSWKVIRLDTGADLSYLQTFDEALNSLNAWELDYPEVSFDIRKVQPPIPAEELQSRYLR